MCLPLPGWTLSSVSRKGGSPRLARAPKRAAHTQAAERTGGPVDNAISKAQPAGSPEAEALGFPQIMGRKGADRHAHGMKDAERMCPILKIGQDGAVKSRDPSLNDKTVLKM